MILNKLLFLQFNLKLIRQIFLSLIDLNRFSFTFNETKQVRFLRNIRCDDLHDLKAFFFHLTIFISKSYLTQLWWNLLYDPNAGRAPVPME